MPNNEVLLVGAGPTGLAMAIELKRQGVPFRIVDKSPQPTRYSQALVVQARTLEQFERYGIADTAVRRGKPLKHASMISEGKTVVSFSFDKIPGHYPFVLFLPQSQTEALLIEHLQSLGVTIERGTELTTITEMPDGVEVQLRHDNGKVEIADPSWVVGCDGAHSAVREGLKIPFSGAKVSLNFFLGDLELEGPDLLGDELRIYLHRGDVVFIGRLEEKVFRMIIAKHSEQEATEHKRDLTLADFQESLDSAGIRLRAISAKWMTPFRVNDRRAEQICHNRVFLAGDASHIHSPVAGQGMNTGIQDVANLAWKLVAVQKGADAALLDSYEEERGMVSEQLLRNTSFVLRAATSANSFIEKVRDTILRAASSIPFVQAQIVGFVSETAIAYHKSSAVTDDGGESSLRAGDRMPNPDIRWKGRDMRVLDGLKHGGHLVVAVNLKNGQDVRERLPRAEFLFLNTSELEKGREDLAELLGGRGEFAVVRPDGYVGFRGTGASMGRLAEYARNIGQGAQITRSATSQGQ